MTQSAEHQPLTPDPGQVEDDAGPWFKAVFVAIGLLPLAIVVVILVRAS